MEDVQGRHDERGIPIEKVGICDLLYPLHVRHASRGRVPAVARLSMSVSLPANRKGTHMSRFVEVLREQDAELSPASLPRLLGRLRERLHAECAHVEAQFEYFIDRAAPVTRLSAPMNYGCALIGTADADGHSVTVRVTVPVTTLCPCSKQISDYGAHNQRSNVTLEARAAAGHEGPSLDELIEIAEGSASSPVYPLVKRPDERYLTMRAFDNPAFAEDVVRNVATKLRPDERVAWFRVHVSNLESIHNHNAFAQIEWSREQKP